jgi:uncharacterized protein YegP (UPF0339 family)
MKYRVEYNQGEDGQWYTSIRHVNGERLYTSEGYTRRESAVDSLTNFVESMAVFFADGENTVAMMMRASLTIEADCE